MTTEEATKAIKLFKEGKGYRAISKELRLPLTTIASFIQKHKENLDIAWCAFCGKEMKPQVGNRTKRFCSDQCRTKYWNSKKKVETRKSSVKRICECCGLPFIDFQNRGRRFCSRSCYLRKRYSNETNNWFRALSSLNESN